MVTSDSAVRGSSILLSKQLSFITASIAYEAWPVVHDGGI